MKISLITVVYNNEHSIEDAIKSVLSQTYNDIEFIVVDGASTDNTLNIIRKYDEFIHQFTSGKDVSNYDAYNKGLKLATGEVIGFLNSDDIYDGIDVIEQVMKTFDENPDVDMVYGDLVYVKKENVDIVVRKWKSEPNYDRFFEDGNVPPHPSLFIKRKVYNIAGDFDISFKLASDHEFMFRVFRVFNFKAFYINRVMVKMRLGGRTNKSLKNIYQGNIDILNVWKKHGIRPPLLLILKRIYKRLIQFI
jgi:glycosyltransferase